MFCFEYKNIKNDRGSREGWWQDERKLSSSSSGENFLLRWEKRVDSQSFGQRAETMVVAAAIIRSFEIMIVCFYDNVGNYKSSTSPFLKKNDQSESGGIQG
jgi:hypothetical protein